MTDGSARPYADLVAQVALVTGAGRGIGRATALALSRRGARVALLARSADQLAEVAAEIASRGGKALALPTDVKDQQAIDHSVERTLAELGSIDVLINNAGAQGEFGAVWEVRTAPFLEALMVNVVGPLQLIRAVVPGMLERRRGVVINVSSGAARQPVVGRLAYGASKAALDQLTRILAAEAKPYGVRAHVFYPGLADTELQAELRTAPGLSPAVQADFRARAVDGRLQRPEVPAATIAWLASPAGATWPDLPLDWSDESTRAKLQRLQTRATTST